MDGERGSSLGEERRSQVIMAFLSVGLHQPPSPAQAVTALASARRMVASLLTRGDPVAGWLASETRGRGLRENAAVLAAMETPEYRQMAAETYAHDHPDRFQAVNDLLAALG